MDGDNDPRARQSVVELEFALSDSAYPFVAASNSEPCRVELEEIVPRGDGRYAEFFSVSDGDPTRLLDLADEYDGVESHLITTRENGGLVEFSVGPSCPAVSLAEQGALPRVVVGEGGTGSIVSELPARHDPATVVESFLDECPDAELVAKREKEYTTPLFGCGEFQRVLREYLTERQREVLRAAYDAGYYDWPRNCTGQEVAEDLGITSATFSQHVHAAERKLLAVLFDDSRGASRLTESSDGSEARGDAAGR